MKKSNHALLHLAGTILVVIGFFGFDHVPGWLAWLWWLGCLVLGIAAVRGSFKALGGSEKRE
jgi:cyanate permease